MIIHSFLGESVGPPPTDAKPTDSSVASNTKAFSKTPHPQSSNGDSDFTAPSTPAKDLSKELPNLNKKLYSPIEPYSSDFLKVSELHTLDWEQSGNPSAWEPFRDFIPENERDNFVVAYSKRLNSEDLQMQIFNVYCSKYDTGGQMWPIVHNTTIFSLVLAQIIAIGLKESRSSTSIAGSSSTPYLRVYLRR